MLQWSLIETEMLLVHAECLRMLNRKDDFVRMLLGLLAKAVSTKTSSTAASRAMENVDIEGYEIQGERLLKALTDVAGQLPYEITVQMSTYFQSITLEPYIRHHAGKEGFQLRVKFRSIFEDTLRLDRATVVLTSSDNSIGELVLESEGPITVSKGTVTLTVASPVSQQITSHLEVEN
jgi:hypothetical protein